MNKEQFWEELKSGKFVSMVQESSKGQSLCSSLHAFNVLKPLFADEDDVEKMYFIFMDQKNSILSIENLFKGSIAGAAIFPREVIKQIIRLKANGIVLAHNHPSGDPQPSREDRLITMRLMVATYSIDVNVLDHIIIGNNYFSMADKGIIKNMKNEIEQFMKGI
jgi:DNA repair protein RadC